VGRVSGQPVIGSRAYIWTDANPARYSGSVVYYRLKQVDSDSSSHYSPVRTVSIARVAGLNVSVYPSPSQFPCTLHVDTEQGGLAIFRLMDTLGHVVAEQQLVLVAGNTSLPLETGKALAPGIYLLQVEQGAQRRSIRLVRE
jgi:hypothetical protein